MLTFSFKQEIERIFLEALFSLMEIRDNMKSKKTKERVDEAIIVLDLLIKGREIEKIQKTSGEPNDLDAWKAFKDLNLSNSEANEMERIRSILKHLIDNFDKISGADIKQIEYKFISWYNKSFW